MNLENTQRPESNMEEERKRRKRRHRRLTGEDIDMFHEREHEQRKKEYVPICDRHIDGA